MVFPLLIGAISTAASAVTATVASIGTAVSSFAISMGPAMSAAIEAGKIATRLASFANIFLQSLSILQPGEQVENLGDRALQAAAQGIKLEGFENFGEYMSALRAFELDPTTSTKYSDVEKLLAGLGIATVALEDKFSAESGSFNGLWLLPLANPQYFTTERMHGLMTVANLGNDVLKYLNKTLSGSDASSFEERLEYGADTQQLGVTEINILHDELDSARVEWAKLSKQIETNIQPA